MCKPDRGKAAMMRAMTQRSINRPRVALLAGLAAGAAVWFAVPVVAQGNGRAMLGTLVKGEWTIKQRSGAAARKICVRSGAELIQLMHRETDCSQFVVEDGAAKVSVQYTCPGNGYGRTSIRRETTSLVQLESQGIHDGTPFQMTAEARRTGPC